MTCNNHEAVVNGTPEKRFRYAVGIGVLATLIAVVGSESSAESPSDSPLLISGEGDTGPWWMQQTVLSPEGHLDDLKKRPWWSAAMQLAIGEQAILDASGNLLDGNGGGAPRMLLRRERFRNRSEEVEAIVWVIDDDADGSVGAGGDRHSDCYIVDYGSDGVVDRMVDYIDNDGDEDPDEMDIRYFVDGQLRQVWCGLDLDDDDAMWDLAGYEYSGDFFKSDPSGNGMIFMNKLDPVRGAWTAVSECPFAFYDPDQDGFSEYTIRVSAVPLAYDSSTDPDYANDVSRYRGEWNESMRGMGVVNIRYSFDADNLNSKESPLHYECGFNLVGAVPYQFPGMEHANPKRRPPQVVRVIPHDALPAISDQFEATETGFSWHEQHDDTISIGDGPRADLDYRWEGVFWIWERRFMENTGGPSQKWNVRREWSAQPSRSRELYYSGVDRRVHLRGAEEGWIQVGHFGGLKSWGEIRTHDTDGNGYFDRWEVYIDGDPTPVRVTTVRDEKIRLLPPGYDQLSGFYTEDVLPEALAANESFMEAMNKVHPYEISPALKDAMQTGSPNDRRFAQDVVREIHYQELRKELTARAHETLKRAATNDLRPLNALQRRASSTSESAWRLIRLLQKLDVAYGQGDLGQARILLDQIAATREQE